jgi:hypothetical protein
MSGHTPGPWAISSVSMETGAVGIAKNRILIAEAHNGYSFMDVVQGNEPAEQFANARLIAAAPELLAAAEAWETADDARNDCAECENEGPWEHCGPCSERFGEAIVLRRAAIAKARRS